MKIRCRAWNFQRRNVQAVNYLIIFTLGVFSFYVWSLRSLPEGGIGSNEIRFNSAPKIIIEDSSTTSQKPTSPTSAEQPSSIEPIEPFEEIEVQPSKELNRTLKWLDLWGDDPNCTKFDVTLLEEKSVESRALVSFPGSGNTWLRMLLMGITGVYINSVYGGDDALFESKGVELCRDKPL